ncbi:HTH-type transcriptional regulator IscR [Clostridium liquoris]|jgi:Rrf2 family protein|uniref:HTH-type transcriptional regulator IscR n=1 Tax=Clostridium liquoris TaxID=1289519 RepID=A0A2T0B3A6_9CLOT|nr:Rrf2 family transcriptional regulator [Clostridium liquoris]PRR78352.1 HTH-type transcriptional regulator IscR [Clostridium liquoris]
MNITQEADYAIRAVLILSKEGEGAKLDAKTIAERGCVPLRFLLKLLRKLIKAGIIKSFRGVNGGYALLKNSKDISLKEVIEAIDGPIAINRCLKNDSFCNANRNFNCSVHKHLDTIQKVLEDELEKVNFEELKNN